ncbi:MAG: oligopeptide/dipeptide ABC transporter ATP-binding protein, partial [Elusimicrobiota bacterium]
KTISEKMAVMYLGEIVETGNTSQIISTPLHPYSQGLLASIPQLKKQRGGILSLEGQAPGLNEIPSGCSFHPRCKKILNQCKTIVPINFQKTSQVRCHLYES